MRRFLGLLLLLTFSYAPAWAQEIVPNGALFKVEIGKDTVEYYETSVNLDMYLHTLASVYDPITITLLGNATGDGVVINAPLQAHVTIDLNGYEWNVSTSSNAIRNEGSVVTIRDSKGGGKLLARVAGLGSAAIYNTGFLEIKGGIIERSTSTAQIDAGWTVYNVGTLFIHDGTFTDSSALKNPQTFVNAQGSRIEIAGGTFNVPITNLDSVTCRIYGGKFETTKCVPDAGLLASGCSTSQDDATGYTTVTTGTGFQKSENIGSVQWRVVTDTTPKFVDFKVSNWTYSQDISSVYTHYLFMADQETVNWAPQTYAASIPRVHLNGFTVEKFNPTTDDQIRFLGPGKFEKIPSYFKDTYQVLWVGARAIELPRGFLWREDDYRLATSEAEIAGTRYQTVEDAIAAALPGDYITLYRNISRMVTIEDDVAINLSDCKFSPLVVGDASLAVLGTGSLEKVAFGETGGKILLEKTSSSVALPEQYEWQDYLLAFKEGSFYVPVSSNTAVIGNRIITGDTTTMMEFIEDGSDPKTVTMQGNVTEDTWSVVAGKKLYLDLNGHTLTLTGHDSYGVLRNRGFLRVQDSKGGGKIQNTRTCPLVYNTGNFGVESGEIISPDSPIRNYDSGRVVIKGGTIKGDDGLDLYGTGGCEITGGTFLCDIYGTRVRIRGGTFLNNPSSYLKGAYRAILDSATGYYKVEAVDSNVQTAELIQEVINGEANETAALASFGTLTKTEAGATLLSLNSPFSIVEGSTVVLNGDEVATVPVSSSGASTMSFSSATDEENAIEANKILDLLNAAYTVTMAADGTVILSYDYAFNVEGLTVTPVSSDDETKTLHDVTFTLVLREGEDLTPRSGPLALDKAKLVVYCNDAPIGTAVRKPEFDANGQHVYELLGVEMDKQSGSANLFKARLEQSIE